MTVHPTPRLWIGGTIEVNQGKVIGAVRVPSSGPAVGLVALAGLHLTWGRTDRAAQPDLATLQVQLFDGTGEWATSTRREGNIVQLFGGGMPDPDGVTDLNGNPIDWEMFRGRITRVNVRPHTADGVTGHLISLTCTSLLTDLGNIVPTTDWPAENLSARMTRVMLAGGTQVLSAFAIRNGNDMTGPVPAAQQKSILEHIRGIYASMGTARMTLYSGNPAYLTFVERRVWTGRGAVGLVRDPAGAARAGQGAYATSTIPYPGAPPNAAQVGYAMYLDGAAVGDGGEGVVGDLNSRISRVQVSYLDPTTYQGLSTEQSTGVDELVSGIRTASVDTITTSPTANMAEWLAWAQTEAGQPVPPTVTVREPFTDSRTARQLLAATELLFPIYVGSSWTTAAGVRPVFGLIGGTISYSGAEWTVQCRLVPYGVTGPQHAISWEEVDDGSPVNTLVWSDVDQPDGLHASLTWADVAHVAHGLGVPITSIPPDTYGWDR